MKRASSLIDESEKINEAVAFATKHDDGQSPGSFSSAEVILIGVSHCGKTLISLYLAQQYGIKAANYPLVPEDFAATKLPACLLPCKDRLIGLSIAPERLSALRNARLAGSRYASLENCCHEVREAELLMQREGISWLMSASQAMEETAAEIVRKIRRRLPVR